MILPPGWTWALLGLIAAVMLLVVAALGRHGSLRPIRDEDLPGIAPGTDEDGAV